MKGTPIGNLGQHLNYQEDGVVHRLAVFEQVNYVIKCVVLGLTVPAGSLCDATYDNVGFRFHKVVRITVLQKVRSLSLACLYRLTSICRIFKGTFVKPTVWTMIAVVLMWTIAFFFANLFQCWPIWINWYGAGGSADQCINTNTMYLVQAWSDVLTDRKKRFASESSSAKLLLVVILTLPLPCVGPSPSRNFIFANLVPDLGDAITCET